MVARDPKTNKSKQIHGLLLTNEHNNNNNYQEIPLIYKERYELGKQRALIRKNKLDISLSVTPPKPDEVEIIHKLYLASRELKLQKNMYLMGLSNNIKSNLKSHENENKILLTNSDLSVQNLLQNLQSGRIKWMVNYNIYN